MLVENILNDLKEACKLEDKMAMYLDGIKYLKSDIKYVNDYPALHSLANSYDTCKICYDKIMNKYTLVN